MIVSDFVAALDCSEGFLVGWKRVRHLSKGHPYDRSTLVEKLRSENHPFSDKEYIYTVNIMKCHECGLTWLDAGLERRR